MFLTQIYSSTNKVVFYSFRKLRFICIVVSRVHYKIHPSSLLLAYLFTDLPVVPLIYYFNCVLGIGHQITTSLLKFLSVTPFFKNFLINCKLVTKSRKHIKKFSRSLKIIKVKRLLVIRKYLKKASHRENSARRSWSYDQFPKSN